MSDHDTWGPPAQNAPSNAAPTPPPVRKAAVKPGLSGPTIALFAAAFALGAVGVTLVARRSTAAQSAAAAPSTAPSTARRQTGSTTAQGGDDEARSGWTGNRQTRWARDGSRTVTYQLSAQHDVPVWMKRVTPLLAVRCLSGRTDVYVVTESSATIESDDRHTVHFAFDDAPDAAESWEESADGQALFAPDGKSFARKIAGARTLRFGFTPYNAAPVVVDFDVSGFDRLIGQVAKTCRWPANATSPDPQARRPRATAAVRE